MIKDLVKILQGKRARKAPVSTLIEAIHMRFGSQRLSFSEYLTYQFHELDDLSAKERHKFLGNGRKYRLNYVCNDSQWFMLGEKLPLCLFLLATGLPMPKIHAVYDRTGRSIPGAISLNKKSDVTDYLQAPHHYPLFVKPSHSAYGWGAVGLKNYLPESNALLFLDGQQRDLTDWINSLNPDTAHGVLFQELIIPHSEIARICGPRASSVRVSTVRIDGQVSVASAVWRIPCGTNMVDNFQHGTSGNLLGGVDTVTGHITRVVGLADEKVATVKSHPDTGISFDGYTLPDWHQVIEICSRAANFLMGMNLHHWDIALTDRGPVIVENNEIADLDLHQLGNRKGFWSDEVEKTRLQSYPRYWEKLSYMQKINANLMRRLDAFR